MRHIAQLTAPRLGPALPASRARGNDERDDDGVVQAQTASTSLLQRRLRVGYTRAGRLIDMLERRGIISGYEGSKPRRVLIGEADLERVTTALSN